MPSSFMASISLSGRVQNQVAVLTRKTRAVGLVKFPHRKLEPDFPLSDKLQSSQHIWFREYQFPQYRTGRKLPDAVLYSPDINGGGTLRWSSPPYADHWRGETDEACCPSSRASPQKGQKCTSSSLFQGLSTSIEIVIVPLLSYTSAFIG